MAKGSILIRIEEVHAWQVSPGNRSMLKIEYKTKACVYSDSSPYSSRGINTGEMHVRNHSGDRKETYHAYNAKRNGEWLTNSNPDVCLSLRSLRLVCGSAAQVRGLRHGVVILESNILLALSAELVTGSKNGCPSPLKEDNRISPSSMILSI